MWTARLAGWLYAAIGMAPPLPIHAKDQPMRGGEPLHISPADSGPSLNRHEDGVCDAAGSSAVLWYAGPDQPHNPAFIIDFVDDRCIDISVPTNEGVAYTFTMLPDVRFHDAALINIRDVAAGWRKIVSPLKGPTRVSQNNFETG